MLISKICVGSILVSFFCFSLFMNYSLCFGYEVEFMILTDQRGGEEAVAREFSCFLDISAFWNSGELVN